MNKAFLILFSLFSSGLVPGCINDVSENGSINDGCGGEDCSSTEVETLEEGLLPTLGAVCGGDGAVRSDGAARLVLEDTDGIITIAEGLRDKVLGEPELSFVEIPTQDLVMAELGSCQATAGGFQLKIDLREEMGASVIEVHIETTIDCSDYAMDKTVMVESVTLLNWCHLEDYTGINGGYTEEGWVSSGGDCYSCYWNSYINC